MDVRTGGFECLPEMKQYWYISFFSNYRHKLEHVDNRMSVLKLTCLLLITLVVVSQLTAATNASILASVIAAGKSLISLLIMVLRPLTVSSTIGFLCFALFTLGHANIFFQPRNEAEQAESEYVSTLHYFQQLKSTVTVVRLLFDIALYYQTTRPLLEFLNTNTTLVVSFIIAIFWLAVRLAFLRHRSPTRLAFVLIVLKHMHPCDPTHLSIKFFKWASDVVNAFLNRMFQIKRKTISINTINCNDETSITNISINKDKGDTDLWTLPLLAFDFILWYAYSVAFDNYWSNILCDSNGHNSLLAQITAIVPNIFAFSKHLLLFLFTVLYAFAAPVSILIVVLVAFKYRTHATKDKVEQNLLTSVSNIIIYFCGLALITLFIVQALFLGGFSKQLDLAATSMNGGVGTAFEPPSMNGVAAETYKIIQQSLDDFSQDFRSDVSNVTLKYDAAEGVSGTWFTQPEPYASEVRRITRATAYEMALRQRAGDAEAAAKRAAENSASASWMSSLVFPIALHFAPQLATIFLVPMVKSYFGWGV